MSALPIFRSISFAVILKESALANGARLSIEDCGSNGNKELCPSELPVSGVIGFIVLGCGGAALMGYILFQLGVWARGCLKRAEDRRIQSQQRRNRSRGQAPYKKGLMDVAIYSQLPSNAYHPRAGNATNSRTPKKVGFSIETTKKPAPAEPENTRPLRCDLIDHAVVKKGTKAQRRQQQTPESDAVDTAGPQPEVTVRVSRLTLDGDENPGDSQRYDDQPEYLEEPEYQYSDDDMDLEPEAVWSGNMAGEFDAGMRGEESEEFFRGADELVDGDGFDDTELYAGGLSNEYDAGAPNEYDDVVPDEYGVGVPEEDYMPEQDEFIFEDEYHDPDLDAVDEFDAGDPNDGFRYEEEEVVDEGGFDYQEPDLVVDLPED